MRAVPADKQLRTAATVILLRDSSGGPEVLLLRRNKAVQFAGGMWVFPGGSLDQADWDAGAGDEEQAARIAAAREALEEADITLDPDTLVHLSHWTTPEAEKKRFYTWFFVAMAPAATAVTIDGSEIHDHEWIGIDAAVARHEAGDMGFFPPTIMTLRALRGYLGAEDAVIGVAAQQPPVIFPVIARMDDSFGIMFAGDAGYATGEPATPGARHRAVMDDGVWRYLYEGDPGVPRIDGGA
jgi:8-oxo-dGTP pyrophosphatase MutT (NUDIX family)